MSDANDDLGTYKRPFKVVACIPVNGRLPLLKHTIERLYKKNGVYKVICSGGDEEKDTCINAGAEFIIHPNHPLGRKWNAAFQAARKHNPDACLFVGSSDWLSDNWISSLSPFINEYDLVGLPGCYFADIGQEYRACYWPGYKGRREGESIGIGRMISRRILNLMNWQPFNDNIDNSLDFSMDEKVLKHAGKRIMVDAKEIFSLSISTNKWINKHKFDQHWNNILKSERIKQPIPFLMNNFPEIFNIF